MWLILKGESEGVIKLFNTSIYIKDSWLSGYEHFYKCYPEVVGSILAVCVFYINYAYFTMLLWLLKLVWLVQLVQLVWFIVVQQDSGDSCCKINN